MRHDDIPLGLYSLERLLLHIYIPFPAITVVTLSIIIKHLVCNTTTTRRPIAQPNLQLLTLVDRLKVSRVRRPEQERSNAGMRVSEKLKFGTQGSSPSTMQQDDSSTREQHASANTKSWFGFIPPCPPRTQDR